LISGKWRAGPGQRLDGVGHMLHGHRLKNVITRPGNIQFRLTGELDANAGQRPGNILLA